MLGQPGPASYPQGAPYAPGYGYAAAAVQQPVWRRWWFWVIVGFVFLVAVSIISGSISRALGPADADPPRQPVVPAATTPAEETAEEEEDAPEPAVDETEAPAAAPSVEPAPPTALYGSDYPADQAAFIARVAAASEAYDAATTDLQRSQAIQQRNADLCSIVPGGTFTNWVGMATNIGGTNDGNAHIDVEIAPDIVVGTWNNELSDIGDNTLIPPGSELFDTLVSMNPDTLVTFSGRFMPSSDGCVYTSNLTETFNAWSPDFITYVTAVQPQ